MERINKVVYNIPSLIERGQELIYPEKYNEWEKCVKKSILDLHHVEEISTVLDIMDVLDKGASMEEAKVILNSQGHDNISEYMVRNIVFLFSNRGPEFWEEPTIGEMTIEEKQIIESQKYQNIQFAQMYKSGKHI